MRLILCTMAICATITGRTDTAMYLFIAALLLQFWRYLANWYTSQKISELLKHRRRAR